MIDFFFVAYFFLCGIIGTVLGYNILKPIDKMLTDRLIHKLRSEHARF